MIQTPVIKEKDFMKEIELTRGHVVIVDDEDFEWLDRFKWYAQKDRRNFYAARRDSHGCGQKKLRMHRVILNAPALLEVDHINGNTLDNRRANIRLATRQQNSFNKKHPRKDNKLGIKGVRKEGKKYRAYITYNHKQINLGHFALPEDADRAYRNAEVKYFGSFARQCGETIDKGCG